MKTLISVVMPVYNCEKYVKDAIESIQKQTLRNWELIVVDDGSSDQSYAIVRSLANTDTRIKAFRNPCNQGLVNTLNFGVSKCLANLICRMDADDVSLPHRLEFQYNYMMENPFIDVMSGWATYIDGHNNVLYTPYFPREAKNPDAIRVFLNEVGNPLVHPATVFRKDKFLEIGGYRKNTGTSEDYDLWLRFAEQGSVVCSDTIVLHYRRWADSITTMRPALSRLYSRLIRDCASMRRHGSDDWGFLEQFGQKYAGLTEEEAMDLLTGNELVTIGGELSKNRSCPIGVIYASRGLKKFSTLNTRNLVKAILIITRLFIPVRMLYMSFHEHP